VPSDEQQPRPDPGRDRRELHDELVRERHEGLARERRADLYRGERDDLVREHRPPSTAERFYPQADPQGLAREELGDVDDGWYSAEPPLFEDQAPARPGPQSRDGRPAGPRDRGQSRAADASAVDRGHTPGRGDSRPQRRTEGDSRAISDSRPGAQGDREPRDGAANSAGPQDGAGTGAEPGATDEASGPELARAVLDAALAKRREAAARYPRRRPGGSGEGSGRRPRGYSGPGPDPRDPQLFGDMLQRLMKARGWERPKAEATVFGAWEKVVGPEIAQHCRPVKLDAGVLTVEAESTAWATQLRMLNAKLLRNIAGEVGHNVVTKMNIHGPAAPSWNKGPRRVQGRGPRDTYG